MTNIGPKDTTFKSGFITLAAHGLQLLAKLFLHAVQCTDQRARPASSRSLTKVMVVSDRSASHPALKLFGSNPPDVLVVTNALKFSAYKRTHDTRPAT